MKNGVRILYGSTNFKLTAAMAVEAGYHKYHATTEKFDPCGNKCTILQKPHILQEDGEVAVVRGFVFPEKISERPRQVVEPELDMHRMGPQQSPAIGRLRELLRWLMPGSQTIARSPMRSIARELEEIWPSSER